MSEEFFYGTGRRKNAVARTRIYPGTGKIEINGRPMDDYFPRASLRMIVQQPLKLTRNDDKLDIRANIDGGGIAGQAEALRHGISRALLEYDAETRKALKKAGLLTRDARVKERKKYGQRGARAKFQYSKR
jgi:small subunit ribosomal protein S9